jgi:hypothetical protein
MTLTQLQALTWTKLNDGGGVFYPNATGALNEAQRLFVLLSLCLERTLPFPLTGGQLAYNVLATLPDFILPRRVYNSSGQQLRPATIAELEALDSGWQNTPGIPQRYVLRGLDWLAIYPQPAAADTLNIVYACCPATMEANGDSLQLRAASQYAPVNYSAWALRQIEGGQELAKFSGYRDEFMAEAKKVGDLIRERQRDSGFATAMPFELTRVK